MNIQFNLLVKMSSRQEDPSMYTKKKFQTSSRKDKKRKATQDKSLKIVNVKFFLQFFFFWKFTSLFGVCVGVLLSDVVDDDAGDVSRLDVVNGASDSDRERADSYFVI